MQSIEYLERIANTKKPPFTFVQLENIRFQLLTPNGDTPELRDSLEAMETEFQNPGDLAAWSPEVLDLIDKAFVKNYIQEDGEPVPSLFFPKSGDNLNRFMTYCNDVDNAIRTLEDMSPVHAREYFAYYSLWQMRGWSFPIPLGTASVVDILHRMLNGLKAGFTEVSTLLGRF